MSGNPDPGSHRAYDIPFLDDTGSNYDDWKFRISTVLRLRGLMGIVKGEEKCPPQEAENPKDQDAVTATYEKWQTCNHQALAEITLTLRKEPLKAVKRYLLASEIWDSLEDQYKGKSQYTMAELLGDIFRTTFVDTISMEHQLGDMREKVHRLKDLGHTFKDSLIATVMIISLPKSYVSLRQHLFMRDENTLTMDFVIRQILMDEKSREATPHVALIGDHKGKKPAHQSLYQKNDDDAKKKEFKYHYCKRKGHFKSECRKLKVDLASNNKSESKKGPKDENAKLAARTQETVINLFMAREGILDLAEEWIIDSGATSPMTARKDWMINYTPFQTAIPIGLGDNRTIKAVRSGSVRIMMDIDGKSSVYEFQDVYYVPDMGTNNLLSVTYMVNKGYFVGFGVDRCEIIKGNMVIARAEKSRNLWILQGRMVSPGHQSAHVAKALLDLWHKRLEHAMRRSIQKLSDKSMVTGLEIIDTGTTEANEPCASYLKGKSTQSVISKKSDVDNLRRLYRLFSDVCGPFDVEGQSKCHYSVTLIDGFSHYMRVKPIRTKDEALKVLVDWITRAEVETSEKTNILRTDGGGEYMGKDFQEWLKSRGIHHELTNPGTPQENGVAERLNRTILDMMRTMMFQSELPKFLWTFAVSYTQEILNRLPSQALHDNKTPYEHYFRKKPSVAHL